MPLSTPIRILMTTFWKAVTFNPMLQAQQGGDIARLTVEPTTLTLDVRGTAQLKAVAYDSAGNLLDVAFLFLSSSRRNLTVDSTGLVTGVTPGEYQVTVVGMPADGSRRSVTVSAPRARVQVTVAWPAISVVTIDAASDRQYAGTTVRRRAIVRDASAAVRRDVEVRWASDNEGVARVDRFGNVTAIAPGTATLLASSEGVTGTQRVTVVPNPTRSVRLVASAEDVRTGDVVHFQAEGLNEVGQVIPGLPITYAVKASVEDTVIAAEAAAEVDQEGAFVAQRAGDYTVVAMTGGVAAQKTISVTHRHPPRRLMAPVGAGSVTDVHTSDLWVWEGHDGRDYAVTGTWGANGVAYFWDVTDPANPTLTDSVTVDARTVNDVKVDPERGICVITREGASNRRNGLVVLDCSNPRDVSVLSTFDDGLLGGVHNVFVWNEHIFAINAGTRFDVISIEDPRSPRRVGFFELDTPGHGIHDVWVEDGIAFASQWRDGVILVDVGNGVAGGTVAKPVEIGRYAYPIGATHSAFPYRAADGTFYVFIGDEQFPYGLTTTEAPSEAGGYIHIVDFSDVKAPKEVARYQVPEAGPHNFWITNDTLYVGYYNAGLRVVDVSGELKGNLYEQGRELARFLPYTSSGFIANAPMVWGAQPHKGHVFFSDFNTGLWSIKMPEPPKPVIP